MAQPTPSDAPGGARGPAGSGAGAVSPPGLSSRGGVVFVTVAVGAWGASTALAPWLAPRLQVLADQVEAVVGLELVPQEVDR